MTPNPKRRPQETLFDANGRVAQTINSMLWAAWADAVGFISELVDDRGLKRRTRGAPLDQPLTWTRRVGGRSGVDAELPAGCWSDDTQLRMAVSRTIGPRGFDVEAFAKVELPIWPAYALGGGRASKAAAANLAKADTLWYANTFDGWVNAGGNGAAMRIQPHVWAVSDLDLGYQRDVVADAVTTHGHPRAIVGSLFHAGCLAHALRHRRTPDTDACMRMADDIASVIGLLDADRYLSMWKGRWEQSVGRKFDKEWAATVLELVTAIDVVSTADSYELVIEALHLRQDDQRGSGLLTPVAALFLARDPSPITASLLTSANAIGTDTDTIATMAGAILGAARPDEGPPSPVLDEDYLVIEAMRLGAIAEGRRVEQQSYPDLLRWVAPQTQADALVEGGGGQLVVEGLGEANDLGRPVIRTPRGDFAWQWVQLSFGQTLLIKRRTELRSLSPTNGLAPPPSPPTTARRGSADKNITPAASRAERPRDRGVDLDGAVEHARKHIDEDERLGYTVRRVARDGSLSDLVALVSTIREDLRR
jgi:ADP-ribosylglycohydrolase